MVLLYFVREQKVEPVCISEFCCLQVCIASCLCVLETILACYRVITAQLLEHIAIYAGVLGIDHIVELQPAFVIHLFVNTHDFLRIHDVIVAVAGLEACGQLACIAYAGASLGTSLGGDDYHAAHCTRTIDRGGRAVLQDGKGLYVV